MLKILTLNIGYHSDKHGLWEKRRELIAQTIKRGGADIVALQAVERAHDADSDQAAELARLLPQYQHVLFHPAQQKADGSAQGLALLSRVALAYSDHLALSFTSGLEDADRRIVLHARMLFDGSPLNIFNAYLSWVPEQNVDNVVETIAYTRRFPGDSVLLGDFNAQPDELAPLYEHGWVDAWARLHPNDSGYTYETGNAEERIDYIWVSEALAERLQSIEIVADRANKNGTYASDHYGLMAELE
jgi:endonuclease/exonuclease/phosphatase family metal-dependent hydrolase